MEKSKLQELLEPTQYICRSYSGRGMYGKECLGVTLQEGDSLGKFFGQVLDEIAAGSDEDEIEVIADDFHSMQTDSMGLGMIVYFPKVPFVDDGVDREYSDEDED